LGFAGIGLMGLPMCKRLLAAGPLTVWNRNPAKCAPLVQAGARQVATPAELCQHADVVMLCLADTPVVREVVFGAAGIVEGAKSGQLLVDFSSLEPTATREMASELVSKTGCWMRRSPAAWSEPRPEASIMVGGEAAALDRVNLSVEPWPARDAHGAVGAGQVTKACNQMIVACNALVIAEVVALAERSGVDASLIAEALAGFADSNLQQISARKWPTAVSNRSNGTCEPCSRIWIPR
jgi:3-hydroxyisobutyrate dehydrogenase